MVNLHKYDDIINLEHHVSKVHKQMSLESRSAQFAPFAALVGYEDAVNEITRYTEEKKELDEEFKSSIYKKLLATQKGEVITITYFIPDNKKQGGKYQTIKRQIRKIDIDNKLIILMNGTNIPVNEITAIN